jgi:hypothetical protein
MDIDENAPGKKSQQFETRTRVAQEQLNSFYTLRLT